METKTMKTYGLAGVTLAATLLFSVLAFISAAEDASAYNDEAIRFKSKVKGPGFGCMYEDANGTHYVRDGERVYLNGGYADCHDGVWRITIF